MVKSASLFSQLLKQIPRNDFAALVKKHQGERGAKGFHLLDSNDRYAVLSDGSRRFIA